jgi:ferredoxin
MRWIRQSFSMAHITILPQQATAEVTDGLLLLDAGEAAGVDMEAGCFNCSCGTCVAEIVSGMENLSDATPEELDVLDQWNKDPEKFRLTCCVHLNGGSVTLRQSH